MKLVITANGLQKPELKPVIDLANRYFDDVVMNPWGRRGTQEEIRRIWDGADAIICGAESFDRPFIEESPSTLKVLSHYGVGVDSIDLDAAKERGIKVCNTPGANADSVAEMAMSLILATAKQTVNHDRHTRLGEWKRYPSFEIKGKTLGIVGFGAIGREVCARARAFGMSILVYDPYLSEEDAERQQVAKVSFDELIERSDVITLHLPSNESTFHMINSDTLKRMKKTAVLINTARGTLVDEKALFSALASHEIHAAGLDVYETEPIHDSPLFALDNVTLMPHCSAVTPEAAMHMGMMAVENAHRALLGLEDAHILV